jgi:intracellular sulfur oxidation DsrE/DsrF family protein
MLLSRRGMFARLLSSIAAGTFVGSARADEAIVAKVAYHLSDADKVGFVLGNIANHIEGMGGPDKVHIVLVVHGPALAAFRTDRANADIARRLAEAAGAGVGLAACGNTLDAQKMNVTDLLPGFVRADEGGVVRLAQLQAQGYAYLRP